MGVSMLLIMLYHQYFTSIIPFNVFHNFGFWGVDIFLFLSGMGLVRSLNTNSISVYYQRRVRRIIPSCIFCGSLKYIVFLLLESYFIELKDGLHLGWWSMASLDLWFIPAIIILYTISPLLYNLLCKWPYLTMTIITIAFFINGFTLKPFIGYNWTTPMGLLSWTIERLPVFTAGMFLAINKEWINNKIKYTTIFFIISIGTKVLMKLGFTFRGDEAICYFALALGIPSLILLCVGLLRVLPHTLKHFISFLGNYSLELYLVHEFIFWGLQNNFKQASPWLILPFGFFLSCITAYLCKNFTSTIVSKVQPCEEIDT